jgi:predicted RNA-binding protein YlxR (DUF448 family)
VSPRRRCVGCGRVAPKSELLRIVAERGSREGDRPAQTRAIVDPGAVLPGRGAYLCRGDSAARPAERCLAQATRRGGIPRALRTAIPGGLVLNDSKLVESIVA